MTPKRKLPWKAVFLLPVLILPLITALFYGLGGGHSTVKKDADGSGLNTQLPGSLPETVHPMDKLSIYQLVERDSLKQVQNIAADPFFDTDTIFEAAANTRTQQIPEQHYYNGFGTAQSPDANEIRVHQKLAELQRQLQSSESQPFAAQSFPLKEEVDTATSVEPPTDSSPDPEMAELNAMLEKVLDIQHPSRVTNKLQEQSALHKDKVFPVVTSAVPPLADLLMRTGEQETQKVLSSEVSTANIGFFEWPAPSNTTIASNAVRAVIHETRTVVSGATIKLRLQQDLFVQGIHIPAGHFVYGKGNLAGDRFTITIRDIQFQDAIFPVSLDVFGMDGIEGIYIEDAIGREVIRSGVDGGVQGMQLASLDPSLKAQVAAGAVETAKSFLGRKLKRTNVTLKAGEPVLLKDSNQQ